MGSMNEAEVMYILMFSSDLVEYPTTDSRESAHVSKQAFLSDDARRDHWQ